MPARPCGPVRESVSGRIADAVDAIKEAAIGTTREFNAYRKIQFALPRWWPW